MITPTLRQLDIFAQMIASGSIAACARDLDMRPADVEREIGILESRLGHQLFDRRGGMVTLTDAGRKTVEAMQMLTEAPADQWEDVHAPEPETAPPPEPELDRPSWSRTATTKAQPEPSGDTSPPPLRETITIAAHPAVFGHFQDALSAFEHTNGDVAITLDLDTHTAAQAIPRLAAGDVDIAYFYALGHPADWPSRYAWSEQLSLYIGSEHPLAAAEGVAREDLASIPAVTLAPGNALRPLIEQALDAGDLDGGDAALETDNLYEIVVAVRQGLGYFAAFGPLARDFSRMKGVKRLPLLFPLPSIDVRQGIRAAVRDDDVVGALSEYLFR
ncbi:MAG: LysR family transcriptional regulator [Sphingobium sp.]|uniref:LysR family transcriptional regulator n=1 Tax=Sphingobium sp. TaxID=1912891 RepID=UPI0029B2C32E|nr:LysR family transcriptional regulator [Sphingobium sp.]MDX3908607.1 LysR family transcriptional regulator [Sphingobium sp.]